MNKYGRSGAHLDLCVKEKQVPDLGQTQRCVRLKDAKAMIIVILLFFKRKQYMYNFLIDDIRLFLFFFIFFFLRDCLGTEVYLLSKRFRLFGVPIVWLNLNLRFYFDHWVDASAGELSIPVGIILPSVFRHWHGLLDISIIEIYSS